MKLYRIYIGHNFKGKVPNIDKTYTWTWETELIIEAIATALKEQGIDNYTICNGVNCYCGGRERTTIIEILAYDDNIYDKIEVACLKLKVSLKQESILVIESTVEGDFI